MLIGVGALLVIAVLALQLIQPNQQAASPTTGNTSPQNAANIPEPEVERVSLAESKAAFDEQTAVFLDVRSAESFAASHIPGAVNIPFDQIETRMSELNPNQWIITYCT